jgi:hypothetical protein
MAQSKSPEQKKSYHVTKAFKGMNTRPNRTALENDEFAWLENIQPIGFGNLKVVPTVANVDDGAANPIAWGNTVTELTACNVNNIDYIIAFQQDGRAEYYNIFSSSKGNVAVAGTFSSSGVRLKQWKNERAIIMDPEKGYFTWDGSHLVPVGSIGSIGITNPGSGYVDPPTVTVSPPDDANGVQATILASISNASGTITNITITAGGSGYTTFPSVTISPPSTPYGVQAQGIVSSITSGAISSIQITNPGSGYTTAPTVTFSSGAAAATAVVGSGLVTALTITNAGTGYTTQPTLTFTGGGGSGATAIAGPLTFKVGTIGIAVTNGGSGYASTPTVVIDPPTGGGITAAATAIVFGGSVVSIIVTNPGSGYITTPNVSFSGGSPTTAATAEAVATLNPSSDIASFSGRVWLSQGRTVYYTSPGTYNDFVSGSAGNITIADDTLHSNITALTSANNFLYVFGTDSINVISDVRVLSSGYTTFTNTNVSASNGSSYPDSIFPYFRSLFFMNQYGIFALVGATVTKVSDNLDGIFPKIDFSYPVQAGQVLVNNILCAAYNVWYQDPNTRTTRPIQLVFFDKKWFVTSQGNIKFLTSASTLGKIWLYASGGSDLVRLYSDQNTSINSTVISALWPMEDTIRDKQALKFGVEAGLSNGGVISITIDSEYGSSPPTIISNVVEWVNISNQLVTWINNSLQSVTWLGGSGYSLYKGDAQQYGKYLGLTVTSNSPGMVLNTLEMEYELRARF